MSGNWISPFFLCSQVNNFFAPEGVKPLFTWEHRKNGEIQLPDINFDAGFGGPVPFISSMFGNLRFFASARQEQDMYLYEVSSPGLYRQSYLLKLTSS
jgi:hypothetical protein